MTIDYLDHTRSDYRRAYGNDARKVKENVSTVVSTVFDLGANTGGSSLALSDAFPDATIHAFEPFNGNFKKLVEVTDNVDNIYTYNVGLSDETLSDVSIGMPVIPKTKRHNYGRTTIHYDGDPIDTINLVKLSDWCNTHKIIPDLIWMDIEGCEHNVVSDLIHTNLIKNIPYLYIELNPVYESSLLIPDMLAEHYEQIYISGKHKTTSMQNHLFKHKLL